MICNVTEATNNDKQSKIKKHISLVIKFVYIISNLLLDDNVTHVKFVKLPNSLLGDNSLNLGLARDQDARLETTG